MRLLFDQNLAPSLVRRLASEFPQSRHVSELGMAQSSDIDIVRYAKDNGFVICTKDSDFAEFAEMGPVSVPVVLIAIGNCSVAQMEELLRANADAIKAIFSQMPVAGAYVVEL